MTREKVDIGALIEQDELVDAAIRRGAYRAMREHIRAGLPMVAWREGKVVNVPPEELVEILKRAGEEV